MSENTKFPDGFLWGSATSAHQVEGNNHNDWTEWENSQKRINELRRDGKNPEDFISGMACDHYNLYEQDFNIVKSLGQNAHRFSIEWSRIEPEEGRFDQEAMEHYINVVKSLRSRGIEPFVTLWHFTNPIWFAKKGAFLNKESPELFARYINFVVDNLKGEVGYWITFNEPTTIYASLSYLKGIWPPHHKNIFDYFKVCRNVTKAHSIAYRDIKKIYRMNAASENTNSAKPNVTSHNVMVGFSENNAYVVIGHNWIKKVIGRIYNYYRNLAFCYKTFPNYDFIGLNYYNLDRKVFKNYDVLPEQKFISSKNWELYPAGIYNRLIELKKFKKPIFITENGIPNVTDDERVRFIKDHLYWIYRALRDGVDVRGYLYWSLLDNFEIVDGFPVRFGLVEMDYETMERKIRPSAYEYKKICESNSLILDSSY